MPILSVLRDECAFSPEETKTCVLAFEEAIRYLGWVKRSDPIASEIARQIIAGAKRGERNPDKLYMDALVTLELGPSGKLPPKVPLSRVAR